MHLVCHVYYFQLPYRYFTTCHLLSENTSPAERLEWDRRYMEGNEMEKSKTLVICDTGKSLFLVWLFLVYVSVVPWVFIVDAILRYIYIWITPCLSIFTNSRKCNLSLTDELILMETIHSCSIQPEEVHEEW